MGSSEAFWLKTGLHLSLGEAVKTLAQLLDGIIELLANILANETRLEGGDVRDEIEVVLESSDACALFMELTLMVVNASGQNIFKGSGART